MVKNKEADTDRNKYENSKGKYQGTPFQIRISDLLDPDKHPEYSQTELASKLGVTPQAVQQYNSGSTYPSLDKIEKIADYFNVSVDYLLGRTEVKSPVSDTRAACEYTGLSEIAIKKLHQIHEKLKESQTADCEISESEDNHDLRVAVVKANNGDHIANVYLQDVFKLECCIQFIDSLIQSNRLEEIAKCSGIGEIAEFKDDFYYMNMAANLASPGFSEQIIKYGRQHACVEGINEAINSIDKDKAFPYISQLKGKLDKAKIGFISEHPREKII